MSTAADPARVVLHPDRPPGVHEAVLAAAARGDFELVDAGSGEETAEALRVPGSILVSYRWQPDFLAEGLSWIQTLGVGVDQFPLEELKARSIPVCNARGVMADCVAEHAFASMLAMTRNLLDSASDQRAHTWVPRIGAELSQMTVGILGLGAIGQEIALRCRAFGMTVLGMRRSPGPVVAVDEVLDPSRINELCQRADVVIVALPGGAETKDLIAAEQLELLGAGWLVHVGRGGTVNEVDLMNVLRAGQLRGAALDVVEGEPLAAGSPLWDTPNLLLTGHSAALSPRWGHAWIELFAANLAAARGLREWASRIA